MASSTNASYIAVTKAGNTPTCLPGSPSPKASFRACQPEIPEAGSTATFRIFSGWCSATSSISIPPSVEAMTVMREVSRSTRSERYSSRWMSQPAST